MNTFDLQIQSTASDGRHSPSEIVAMAKEKGLGIIALTDHDTAAGVAEALRAGAEQGVRVIPGIELSVEERGVHILGYGIRHQNTELLFRLEEFKAGRMEGAKQMVENLRSAGFAVSWEDVLRQVTGALVARPHIARAILERADNKGKLGGINTAHDFIDRFLSDQSPYYVRRTHVSAKDGIGLIHSSKGTAVWSHPAIHFKEDPQGLEDFLKRLIGWGIEGVEVFSPSHTEDDAELLQDMAARYGLLRTGGSDFHEKGEHQPDEQGLRPARRVGDFPTYGFPTSDIVPKLEDAIKRKISSA